MKEATDAGNGGGRAGRRRQSDGRSRWRRPSRTTAATRLTLQTAATEQDGWLCGGRGYGVDREGRMRRVGGSEETAAAGSTRSAVAVEEGRPGELKRRRTPRAGGALLSHLRCAGALLFHDSIYWRAPQSWTACAAGGQNSRPAPSLSFLLSPPRHPKIICGAGIAHYCTRSHQEAAEASCCC